MTWITGGHNDWFSVNLDGPQFQVQFNHQASILYKNFDDAADQAAKLLYQEWGHRPLYLALSGGIDSECVARILLKNKIPFVPLIARIGDLNAVESQWAINWCKKNKIAPVLLNFTVDDLIDSFKIFFPRFHQVKHYFPGVMMNIYNYVEEQGGFCIYCAGDINLDFVRKQFFHYNYDFISSIIGNHPTAFFMYTPELVLSYISQFDVAKIEQINKLKFYQVEKKDKIDYVSLIPAHRIQKPMNDLFHIFKIKKQEFDPCYWYGTKEQIIQQLTP